MYDGYRMEFPAGVFTPQTFIFKIILLRINDFHAQCDLTVFLQTPKTFFLKTMFTVLCFLCTLNLNSTTAMFGYYERYTT